jgi:MraZ protein
MQVMGFIGQANAAIDPKGRVSFPKDLRQYLAPENEGRVVVTIGPEKSLVLYPLADWNQFAAELAARPRTLQNNQFRIQVMAHAKESILDQQNRITLSAKQMAWANLDADATFVGEGSTVRIFQPAHYSELYEQEIENFDQMFYWDSGDQT